MQFARRGRAGVPRVHGGSSQIAFLSDGRAAGLSTHVGYFRSDFGPGGADAMRRGERAVGGDDESALPSLPIITPT